MVEQSRPQGKNLSDRLRTLTQQPTQRVGAWLHRAGVHPDAVSILGWGLVAVGAVLIARGQFVAGGWVIFVGGLLDVADGAVARAMGREDAFGGVLDSTLDRYADGLIFGSLSYYFAGQNQPNMMLLALAALVGSYMVSYIRARADGPDLQLRVTIGAFSRFERLALIVWALWLPGWLLVPALWILAAGTNLTALQRLWYVRKNIEV